MIVPNLKKLVKNRMDEWTDKKSHMKTLKFSFYNQRNLAHVDLLKATLSGHI